MGAGFCIQVQREKEVSVPRGGTILHHCRLIGPPVGSGRGVRSGLLSAGLAPELLSSGTLMPRLATPGLEPPGGGGTTGHDILGTL